MISVGMSTTCVYPFAVEHAFRMAHLAGFDSMEVMVTNDPVTQDAAKLREFSERYELPIVSIHAPVLLLTTFVWGRDPQVKLEKSGELAAAVGADSVVVHPPFRWQSGYAQNFERIVRETAASTGVEIAVENMFPWTVRGRAMKAYAPSPNPLDLDVLFTDGRRPLAEALTQLGADLREAHRTLDAAYFSRKEPGRNVQWVQWNGGEESW